MKYLHLTLALIFLLCAGGVLHPAGTWKIKKNKNGVVIKVRPMEGSSLNEYMGIIEINAPLEVVSAALKDIARHRLWMYRLVESKIIKIVSSSTTIIYYKMDSPWPVQDRDMYLKTVITGDIEMGKLVFSSQGLKGYPDKKGCIRITNTYIRWVLKRSGSDNKKTSIVCTGGGDPAGKLPEWVANLGTVTGPYENLLGLKKHILNKRYWSK